MTSRGVISILPYKLKKEQDEEIYREYMARCARLLTENIARLAGGNYIKIEYEDIINPKQRDMRSADEIVHDIITQAGIEVITK